MCREMRWCLASLLPDARVLLGRGRGRKAEQRGHVVREARQLGEILLHRVAPGQSVEFHVRKVVAVEALAACGVAPQGLRPHQEALEELPRVGDVDLREVALDGRGVEVGVEPGQVDAKRLERAEEEGVALEAIQPDGRVGIDGLEGARDHLEAGVVDLVIGQPLHEDPVRPERAPAQLVELPGVEVAVAGVLGIEGVHRHHVVAALRDQQEVAPVVDGDAHARVGEHAVVDLREEAGGADHVRHELDDVQLAQPRVAGERPGGPAGAEPDHQRAVGRGVQQHGQVRQELLDLGIVVHEGHVRIGGAGAGDRPAVDAQELAIVDVGGDLHHAGRVLRVVQDGPLRLAGDVGEAERRRDEHDHGEEPQRARVDEALPHARHGPRRQEHAADPHARERREGQAAVQAQEGNRREAR